MFRLANPSKCSLMAAWLIWIITYMKNITICLRGIIGQRPFNKPCRIAVSSHMKWVPHEVMTHKALIHMSYIHLDFHCLHYMGLDSPILVPTFSTWQCQLTSPKVAESNMWDSSLEKRLNFQHHTNKYTDCLWMLRVCVFYTVGIM